MFRPQRTQIVFVLGLTVAAGCFGQYRRQRGTGGRASGTGAPPSEVVQAAVVHFEGTLRNFDKKKILLDHEDGQMLTFRRNKNTAFIPAGKHTGLDLGVAVQIEAHRDSVGDLDAIRVCEGTCPAKSEK